MHELARRHKLHTWADWELVQTQAAVESLLESYLWDVSPNGRLKYRQNCSWWEALQSEMDRRRDQLDIPGLFDVYSDIG